ncbi:MAG: ubiquinol-cytochrome c reductase iron-sulfur subunit [Paracoccaceae bacterium]
MSQTEGMEPEKVDGDKRDFLFIATGAAGAVTVGAIAWPLVNQMNPAANVRALATIETDVSNVSEGSEVRVMWRGKPVFIRHRTAEEIERARAVDLGDLPDPQPDSARTLDEEGKWLVQLGVCTHLGCVPLGNGAGEYNGWFCPCHGSHYDIAGRIRKGPAPRNLDVPPAKFVDDTTIQLG